MGTKRILTKKEALQAIKDYFSNNQSLNKLYSEYFLVRKGKTSDTSIEYQELYAKYIYDNLSDNKIPYITEALKEQYCKNARKEKEGNDEEKIQREFYFGKKESPELGKCIWFELDVHRNGKGIDLVFLKDNILNIVELKYNNKNEPLLRPIIELQTYFQRINWDKALDDLRKQYEALPMTKDLTIKKYIMLDEKSLAFQNYSEIQSDSYLKKLLDVFEIFVISYK